VDPLQLDYFAAAEPDRRRAARVRVWSLALVAGWLPYACGVVNALVAAQSYSAAVARQHAWGTAVFMGAGLLLSVAGLIGFVRLRHGTGIAAACLVILLQVAVGLCLGLAPRR
jgi:hypothetical protein